MNRIVQNYARALHDALHQVRPEDQDRVLDNFLEVLRTHDHLDLVEEIEKEFIKIKPEDQAQENKEILEHFNNLVKNDPELSHKARSAKAIIISDEKESNYPLLKIRGDQGEL